ncbi:diacylglycerol kinase [Azovibrio restrictus]|uniref:diacylglycerol kinase n=1 Tax=Azovibrio restrictus TaxID=146938 RepID=UPI0026F30A9F|nr:diacylglycerol kinase [Azovibrio restrictus]MCE1172384.1 diacylglycerol kinase [Azovibrio sp.]MDD3484313.1 diacylglycerol kinase [Azovibrio restrictus]
MNEQPSAADLKGKTGLTRLWNALGYSKKGIAAAWKHEAAFRQEMLLLLAGVPLGLWLGRNGVERALLLGSLILVPVVELLNSAVEAVVDKTSPEYHELAGRAKDLGSAAVLFALVFMAVVWACVLWP